MYRDSMGIWDGVQWSGHTVLFYSIQRFLIRGLSFGAVSG